MYKISGTTITLKQGDTLRLKVNLVKPVNSVERTLYTPPEGTQIRFIAKQKLGGSKPVAIESDVAMESMMLEITSEQTKELNLRGRTTTFTYDLELIKPNGDVATLISNAKLVLVPEVA